MLTISKPKVRTLIKQDFETAFEQVDVLVCPTVPTTAFKVGKNSWSTQYVFNWLDDDYS